MASGVSEFIDKLRGSKHPGEGSGIRWNTVTYILQLHQLTGIQLFWDEPFCVVALSIYYIHGGCAPEGTQGLIS
jgi:hypothetical protein